MDYPSFIDSIAADDPPLSVSAYLRSLWFDAKGDWHSAHDIIQNIHDEKAALVHAYLHRKEGDTSNAEYWYKRAGTATPGVPLQKEWENLVRRFL